MANIKTTGNTKLGHRTLPHKRENAPKMSKDIAQHENEEKCTDNPRAFYDIGFGVQLYSTSDVSKSFRASRWKSDDFQSTFSDDATFKNYKCETDAYHIDAIDPKDKHNFPKDSLGMITVRVKLPNDINYQLVQLKAYIKFDEKWTLFDVSLEDQSVRFETSCLNVLCIVSKPIKESLNISPAGCEYVAQTDDRIKISIPPGAVENDETVCIHIIFREGHAWKIEHSKNEAEYVVSVVSLFSTTRANTNGTKSEQFGLVIPVNKDILRRKFEESNKTGEAILAMSDCLFSSDDKTLKKKVRVKLPLHDIRKPNESDKEYEYRLFRQTTNGQFSLTDNLVMVDENHIAVFETNKISGTSVSLIGKEELKKDSLVVSGNIEEMHGLKAICKILFFVNEVTQRGLTVLLACIEKSKMQDFCNICEEMGFQLFKSWISKDFSFKPQTKIDIVLRGFFTLPRFATRKKLKMIFLPNSAENFTRFRVDIKRKMEEDPYGLMVLTQDQELLDEICYDESNINAKGSNTKTGSYQKTSTKGKLPVSGSQKKDEVFLTEKGVMTVAKLLNADKIFETVIYMNMKQHQYEHICEKIPAISASRQAFVLLKTALDNQKNNKVDTLIKALEKAGEGGLANNVRQCYKEGQDMSKIKK